MDIEYQHMLIIWILGLSQIYNMVTVYESHLTTDALERRIEKLEQKLVFSTNKN